MQATAKYGKPVIESVVVTMSAEQAKFLHRFLVGTTSNTVIEATGLKYNDGNDTKNDSLIYAINDALADLFEVINDLQDELGLPEYYY